jgi:hypothetical protein
LGFNRSCTSALAVLHPLKQVELAALAAVLSGPFRKEALA